MTYNVFSGTLNPTQSKKVISVCGMLCVVYHFVPGRGVMYCYHHVCLSVWLLTYLKNHMSKLRRIVCAVTCGRGSDNSAVSFVLPVLWMSCFHIIGHVVYCEAYSRGM